MLEGHAQQRFPELHGWKEDDPQEEQLCLLKLSSFFLQVPPTLPRDLAKFQESNQEFKKLDPGSSLTSVAGSHPSGWSQIGTWSVTWPSTPGKTVASIWSAHVSTFIFLSLQSACVRCCGCHHSSRSTGSCPPVDHIGLFCPTSCSMIASPAGQHHRGGKECQLFCCIFGLLGAVVASLAAFRRAKWSACL